MCFSIISFIEPFLVSYFDFFFVFCLLSLAKPAILFVGKVGSFEEYLSSGFFFLVPVRFTVANSLGVFFLGFPD